MANIQTPVGTLSYPNLFHARAYSEGDDPEFSCAIVWPEGTDLTELKRAAIAKAKDRWGDKAEPMIRGGKLRMPFRTDSEDKGYAGGSTFMNVRSEDAPGIVSTIPDPNTGRPMPITDESQIYPGVQAKLSLKVFAYDKKGNKGVSFNLCNVQKVADGPRLDGRKTADEEFEADPNAVADLSDMETVVADAPLDENDLSELL
jgi:hypothetical protein